MYLFILFLFSFQICILSLKDWDFITREVFNKYMNLRKYDDPSTVLVTGFTTSGKNQDDVFISVEKRYKHARTMRVLLQPWYIYGLKHINPNLVEFRVASYKAEFIMKYTITNPKKDKYWFILAEQRYEDQQLLKDYKNNYLDILRPKVESMDPWNTEMRKNLGYLLNQLLQIDNLTDIITNRYRINGIGGTIKPTLSELAEHLRLVTGDLRKSSVYNFIIGRENIQFSMKVKKYDGTSYVYHYRLVKVVGEGWLFDEEFNDGEHLTDKIVTNKNLDVLRWGDNIRN
ncbi:unnamed protein product [Caenorhabditis angaria]|uniref:Uncharacterized protein n=1 Tax=Caenorhabditis angaria TaxID=860376 RepID=A0A9P1INP9_9PELO|nr:unnamed protein product [Caenorhabditis angaria]